MAVGDDNSRPLGTLREPLSGPTSVAGPGSNVGTVGPPVVVSRVQIDGYTATTYRGDSVSSGILEPGGGKRKREHQKG